MSALTVKPPYLMYAWAFLAAVSVAVVLMMDFPFSGGITVNLWTAEGCCRLHLALQASPRAFLSPGRGGTDRPDECGRQLPCHRFILRSTPPKLAARADVALSQGAAPRCGDMKMRTNAPAAVTATWAFVLFPSEVDRQRTFARLESDNIRESQNFVSESPWMPYGVVYGSQAHWDGKCPHRRAAESTARWASNY